MYKVMGAIEILGLTNCANPEVQRGAGSLLDITELVRAVPASAVQAFC